MSGIAGIVSPRGAEVHRRVVSAMVEIMRHRGPDGCTIWSDQHVGIGHCALQTRVVPGGSGQPAVDSSGSMVLTADARIDNRGELRSSLGMRRRHLTDADLILEAYRRWGTECPERLVGTYAFAVWDATRHRVFLARDRIGVRPLYYHLGSDGTFVFGSELKSVFASGIVKPVVREARVAEFLAKEAGDIEATFFEGVLRLPPAHAMVVYADGRSQQRRYWSLDPEAECRLPDDAAYEERFAEVFTEAVRCRQQTGVPTGVLLSGGLDSSSVACVARSLRSASEGPLPTFSAIFPDLPAPERRRADEQLYLDALDAKGGFDMHRVSLSGVSPLHDMERVIRHLDQPPLSCNIYLTTHLFRRATDNGVRILLDGSEGDVAVSHGYGFLAELVVRGDWDRLQSEVEALSTRMGVATDVIYAQRVAPYVRTLARQDPWRFFRQDCLPAAAMAGEGALRLAWHQVIRPRLPGTVGRAIDRIRGRKPTESVFHPLINRDLVQRTHLQERLEERRRSFRTMSYTERKQHWASLHLGAGPIAAILEEVSHLTAMCGGERVHPFYDVRLIEYCLSLPPDQKLRDGWTRSILRRSMEDVLPPRIRHRTSKGDLSPNFRRELIQDSRLRALLEDGETDLERYINARSLRTALERKDVVSLWAASVLSLWLSRVADLPALPVETRDLTSAAIGDSTVASLTSTND